jgi:hypothetical protein
VNRRRGLASAADQGRSGVDRGGGGADRTGHTGADELGLRLCLAARGGAWSEFGGVRSCLVGAWRREEAVVLELGGARRAESGATRGGRRARGRRDRRRWGKWERKRGGGGGLVGARGQLQYSAGMDSAWASGEARFELRNSVWLRGIFYMRPAMLNWFEPS